MRFAAALLCLSALGMQAARADEAPEIRGELVSGELMPALSWKSKTPLVVKASKKGRSGSIVRLEGTYANRDWILVLGEQKIARDAETGVFSVDIESEGPVTPFVLHAISPKGEIQTEKAILYLAWAEAPKEE